MYTLAKHLTTQNLTSNSPFWLIFGARHLYLNFDGPRLLVLISGYPRFLTSFFCMTLGSQGQGHGEMTLDGWAPGTCILILMIHDF